MKKKKRKIDRKTERQTKEPDRFRYIDKQTDNNRINPPPNISGTDLYGEYSLHHHLAAQAAQDPWQYAAQVQYSREGGDIGLIITLVPKVL